MADPIIKPHAIFFAYPLQGHVIPAVHLAIKLASRGFTITFINSEAIHLQTSRAHPDSGENPFSKTGLDIRYRTISDGLPPDFDRSLNHDEFMESLLHSFSGHAEAAVSEIVAAGTREGSPVSLIIADTFFVWPSKVAKKFGLVYASFWTEPALVFTLYHHMHLLRKNRHFDCPDTKKETIDYIPGVKAINPQDMTSYLQATDTDTVCHKIIATSFDDARGADYILCNSVEALEPETIRALHSDRTPFYAVGPVFPPKFKKSPVAMSLWSESDCTAWLDNQPRGSVIYASFGSYAHVAKRDLAEIAHGLSLSRARFLWVLRPDIVSSEDPDPLPEGFSDDVADRAMMVQWCSQIEVLAHPAIGGFLTHCGWNSILESVWCEVPLLCFPLLTDQFTNRKLVVDDWKIGISLNGQGSVTRNEVAMKVNDLLGGVDFGKAVRVVKKSVEEAIGSEGSSERNLDKFIADMNMMSLK